MSDPGSLTDSPQILVFPTPLISRYSSPPPPLPPRLASLSRDVVSCIRCTTVAEKVSDYLVIESLHAITLGLTGIDTRAITPLLWEIKIPYSYGRRSPAAAKQERIFGNSNVRRQDRSTRLWGQGQPSHRPLVRRGGTTISIR